MAYNRIKVAFLDRDGVINKNAAPHEYITAVENFKFNDGVFELLARLANDGYEIIILTNQRGIARGMLTEQRLSEIHTFMRKELEQKQINILDIFYCPHNENECDCRKPKPGLLIQATKKYDIDLDQSILISDSQKDVDMGKNFGIQNSYLIEQDKPSSLNLNL